MRFDDSLKTVLAGEAATGIGASATWRQLVDLLGRGRAVPDEPTIARLRLLRQAVPTPVRAATARALAFADPGAALVGLFAEDELVVAAPVLRTADLLAVDWIAVLPRLSPEGRSILRHRRDLPVEVVRALESFGRTDFVLPWEGAPPANDDAPPEQVSTIVVSPPSSVPLAHDAIGAPPADTPLDDTPFVTLADVARSLPLVDEALRLADSPGEAPSTARPGQGGFVIAELVARIDAFNRARDAGPRDRPLAPLPATGFSFETDPGGIIRWVDGIVRGPLIGVSIAHGGAQGVVRVDAAMNGALRQRARFAGARLDIGGQSDAAGSWRVSGEPLFDDYSGRFLGMRAAARRLRSNEGPASPKERRETSDALRELVHELRTPTNAIAGFAELIESQLLGPVPPHYRRHALTIRDQAALLLAAIDDLDTAARLEGGALDLAPRSLPLAPLIERILDGLASLSEARSVGVDIHVADDVTLFVDERAGERLLSRLLAMVVAPAQERVVVTGTTDAGVVTITLPAPRDDVPDEEGATLLGSAFTLRLARNLAAKLGGSMETIGDRLVLTLPAPA